ncbi:MAG: hypothetical protein QF921_04420 [Pseudomonadales bacterium]|nr:hypothetical protein [Pseudomonadales bacterium]MDP6473216.1 hypothetical protein [Pseudomonadales bacterium]MDP6826024.1 hypothetical protein [Pseudomonadales bacterium]MDP6970747.1 hypothetical protein [Pseudomonadales bacterium]
MAPSVEAVDEFYRVSLILGAIDEGSPGISAKVHDGSYACYVRDLDGNKVVAVCQGGW